MSDQGRTNRSRVPSSFRDPSGYLFWEDGELFRSVSGAFRADYDHCRSSGFFDEAFGRGLLIPHEEVAVNAGDDTAPDRYALLKPERIPFISYPYEWSFSQLQDAALLTLELQLLALEHDLSLRDASAFNVQFHRGRPVFIDTLSFERYPENRPWVAYQQFCRHFLAPLALFAHCDPSLGRLSALHIDGVPLDLASRLLPGRTRLHPRLLAHIHLHARSQRVHQGRKDSAARARTQRISRHAVIGLVESLRAAVRGLGWRPAGTEWADYYDDTNYSDRAADAKARALEACLDAVAPESVWDLGANTGRFSRVAARRGAHTVAFDVDPAAVEKNYLEVRRAGEEHLLPLVLDLTNPSPALGWHSEERDALRDRGPVDLVIALALVHHLAISNNLPLSRVAEMLGDVARVALVEFVPKTDSQVQRLLASREDIFPDYTQAGFEAALCHRFRIRQRIPVDDSERVLYLLERG